jgi:hypothetical protein
MDLDAFLERIRKSVLDELQSHHTNQDPKSWHKQCDIAATKFSYDPRVQEVLQRVLEDLLSGEFEK